MKLGGGDAHQPLVRVCCLKCFYVLQLPSKMVYLCRTQLLIYYYYYFHPWTSNFNIRGILSLIWEAGWPLLLGRCWWSFFPWLCGSVLGGMVQESHSGEVPLMDQGILLEPPALICSPSLAWCWNMFIRWPAFTLEALPFQGEKSTLPPVSSFYSFSFL